MSHIKLHSTVSGRNDGPVLLLLNSLGATNEMWDPQIKLLEAHYRVIRCDTRGHGQSPTPPAPYHFDDIVADVIAVLDRYDVARATVLAVRADSPFETFEDLVAASKADPGKVQMAHSGNWGAFFIPAAQMMTALDMQWNLVPYQGGGPALQAMLSGDADLTMGFPSSLASHVEAGTVRILATAGAERLYDDIPTFGEVGVEGDIGFMHRVVLAPADTPEEALTTLREAFVKLAEDKTFGRMMGRLGENIDILIADDYDAMRVEQSKAYKELVDVLTSQ